MVNFHCCFLILSDEGEISLSQGGGVSFKKLSLQDDDGLETHPERPAGTM